jgi:hypothetical protein
MNEKSVIDALRELVEEKLLDLQTPGFIAEFSPEEATFAGAFYEDALSEFDAHDSAPDSL